MSLLVFPSNQPGPIDARELVLLRFQDVISTLAPGVTFTFPLNRLHAPIATDIHGRCYSRMLGNDALTTAEKPRVEFIASPSTADTLEYQDDDSYEATTRVLIWGYVGAGDAGTDPNATTRRALNALRADIIIALAAAPYWAGVVPAETDSLVKRLGNGVSSQIVRQWTEDQGETAMGTLVIEADIKYPFNVRYP